MRVFTTIMLVSFLTVPAISQATLIWSASCQTVVSVINEPVGSNGNVLLGLSPGISGCVAAGAVNGGVMFMVGQDGVTADSLNGLLASNLTAMTAGKQVKITYDNRSSACYATAIGGLAANVLESGGDHRDSGPDCP